MTQFDGKGFSTDEIKGDEAAQVRHMFHTLDENWIKISPDILASMESIQSIVKAIGVIHRALQIGAPVAIAAAALGVFAKSQGLLP